MKPAQPSAHRFGLAAWLLFWAIWITSPPLFAQDGTSKPYPFSVTHEAIPGGQQVVGKNKGDAPVSVFIRIDADERIDIDRATPIHAVVPAHSQLTLAKIKPKQAGQYTFKIHSKWNLGDYTANPPLDAVYRLPFEDGKTFRIGQSPGGPITTHTTPDSQYAVDIPMPEGTPIVAAREGMVVRTEEEQTESGQRPELISKANSVRILHSDGSIGIYAHLTHKGVLVSPGQMVKAGQVIGLAGSTGYSSGPHLHFAVLRLFATETGFRSQSLPFRFTVGNPPVTFIPSFGMVAKADYQNPGQIPPVVIRSPRSTNDQPALVR